MKQLFICIPTYNEAENIIKIIKSIEKVSKSILNYNTSIVVIDDGSPDNTAGIVNDYSKESTIAIHIINNGQKGGLGKAYITGFKYCIEHNADAICQMDADFSHDPKYLPEIVSKLDSYDFVLGSRYVKGGGTLNWSFSRKFISRFGNFYSGLVLSSGIEDMTGGFNCWRAEVLKAIDLNSIESLGFSFQIELKYKAIIKGFTFFEVPIIFKDREFGVSKFNSKIFEEALLKPWKILLKTKAEKPKT